MITSEESIVISVNQVKRKCSIIPMKKKHDEYEDICLKQLLKIIQFYLTNLYV